LHPSDPRAVREAARTSRERPSTTSTRRWWSRSMIWVVDTVRCVARASRSRFSSTPIPRQGLESGRVVDVWVGVVSDRSVGGVPTDPPELHRHCGDGEPVDVHHDIRQPGLGPFGQRRPRGGLGDGFGPRAYLTQRLRTTQAAQSQHQRRRHTSDRQIPPVVLERPWPKARTPHPDTTAASAASLLEPPLADPQHLSSHHQIGNPD